MHSSLTCDDDVAHFTGLIVPPLPSQIPRSSVALPKEPYPSCSRAAAATGLWSSCGTRGDDFCRQPRVLVTWPPFRLAIGHPPWSVLVGGESLGILLARGPQEHFWPALLGSRVCSQAAQPAGGLGSSERQPVGRLQLPTPSPVTCPSLWRGTPLGPLEDRADW